MIRVIAGDLRGRRLRSPDRETGVRPTADRVKTVLFDMLGSLTGLDRVLDLFAGTGALGIEALSRGVTRVTFVERDARALGLLTANLDGLGIRDRARIWRGDAMRFLSGPALAEDPWPLIVADPPYGAGVVERLLVATARCLAPGGTLVLEHGRIVERDADAPPEGLKLDRRRVIGDTTLSIYVAAPPGNAGTSQEVE